MEEPITVMVGYEGAAIADSVSYEGYEDLYFTTENGLGETLCRISYKVTAVDVRTDCADCEWAFELRADEPEIVEGTPERCADLGYDEGGIEMLLDTPRAYGFAPEYFGHASVLLVADGEGQWSPVSFASWSQVEGTFDYDWETGYLQI